MRHKTKRDKEMGRNAADLTGRRDLGTLRPLSKLPGKGKARWLCLCDPELGGCGQEHIAHAQNLLGGQTQSCGCRQNVKTRARRVSRRTYNPLITL